MQTRKSVTKEFKLEALRLLDKGNQPAAKLATELVVRRNQLYQWSEVCHALRFEFHPEALAEYEDVARYSQGASMVWSFGSLRRWNISSSRLLKRPLSAIN